MAPLSPILQNVLPFVIVALLVWAVVHARHQPLWAEAYRRLARNPLALMALGVICLYGVIAVLDSLQWRDTPTEEPKTILDRLFAHVPQERTYSAPFATMTTGEPQLHALAGMASARHRWQRQGCHVSGPERLPHRHDHRRFYLPAGHTDGIVVRHERRVFWQACG